MTAQWRERVVNYITQALIAIAVVLITFGLSRGAIRSDNLKKELEERPKFEYVNDQDEKMQKYVDDQNAAQDASVDANIKAIHGLLKDQNDYLKMIISERFKGQKTNP